MKTNVNRIIVGFVAAFAAICVGLFAYDATFVWPIKTCEENGHWWDEADRLCAIPVPLSTITGRRLTPAAVRAAAGKPAPAPNAAKPPAKPAGQSPTKR